MAMPDMLFAGLGGVGALALIGSYLGWLHPAGDSLAVFRGPLALAGGLWIAGGALAGLCPWWLTLLPLAALLGLGAMALRPERGGPVTLYQKNMSYRMQDVGPLARDIRAIAPDLLTLQEVTPANAAVLEAVSDILPHSHLCSYEHVGGVGLASRWPIRPGSLRCAHGLVAAQVEMPEGPVWLVSIHMKWPWPSGQPIHHPRLMQVLAGLEGPVILAGDFNMVRWSSVVRKTAHLIGAEPAGRPRGTFWLKRMINLPIDQILVPDGRRGATEARELLGSDHRGLVARF
jgi:endonuclease/exonuclease/phosphatase (EEP) superfamily protein YafD